MQRVGTCIILTANVLHMSCPYCHKATREREVPRISRLMPPTHTCHPRRVTCCAKRPCLSGADWCLQSDAATNPPIHALQSMARVWRDGQRKTVHIYRTMTSTSIRTHLSSVASTNAVTTAVIPAVTNAVTTVPCRGARSPSRCPTSRADWHTLGFVVSKLGPTSGLLVAGSIEEKIYQRQIAKTGYS